MVRTTGSISLNKKEKYPCYLCHKLFVNPTKHRCDSCPKRFDALIGPLPEVGHCPKCNTPVYRLTFYEKILINTKKNADKKILVKTMYPLDEHVELCSGGIGYNESDFVKSKEIISIDEF